MRGVPGTHLRSQVAWTGDLVAAMDRIKYGFVTVPAVMRSTGRPSNPSSPSRRLKRPQ